MFRAIKDEHRARLEKVMKRLDSSFFFYDLDHLRDHLTHMDQVKDSGLKLWYACKANPLSAILKIFRNLNFGVDVASIGELNQVLSAGVEPENVLSTGPSKGPRYMEALLRNEVNVIVLESLNQAYWLDELAKEKGLRPKVLLRCQLEWSEGVSVLGGNEISAFGVEPDVWKTLDKSKVSNLDITGFHVFQWGNILDLRSLEEIWDKITSSMVNLASEMGVVMEVLDLGGGLGIPYSKNETMPDFKKVNEILIKIKEKYSIKKIWMELGRYAVGECGHYYTKVIDRKTVRGRELLILDGGMNHIARPSLTDQAFPVELFRESKAKTKEFYLHGPLCTALDKLGAHELPEDVGPGDWLAFHQAGAYGFTEAMPFFLCHDLPAEVLIYNGDVVTPRTIKTSTDWLV